MGEVDTEAKGRLRLYGSMPAWFRNDGPDCDVVISTRVRLARNVSGYRFTPRAPAREKQKVYREVSAALKLALKALDVEAVNYSRLNKVEQLFLVEERRVSIEMFKGEGERGAVCDIPGRLNVMINEEDHLRIQGMDSGFRSFDMWKWIDKIDNGIGKKLKYAYSDRLGFLTACPTNSGTGLRLSYLMHLPGLVLTKAIDPVLQGASQMGIATRGFFGEHSDVVGNFFQLSNNATLGASEEEFIEATSNTIREIINHEREARKKLLKDALMELEDKIWRARGILRNARMLSLPEMLNLTSAIRLGIDCGIYNEHSIDGINKMIMLCMPAHLQLYICGKYDKPPEDLDIARADVMRILFSEGWSPDPEPVVGATAPGRPSPAVKKTSAKKTSVKKTPVKKENKERINK